MTENGGGESETGGSGIENVYNHWLKSCGVEDFAARKFAVDQTLHPDELNNIPWENGETPRKIAEFVVQEARDEA